MDQQTPHNEGEQPTQAAGMSPNDSAPKADPPKEEAKPAELRVIEETLGREFENIDEAKKALTNLKSMVGDQTVAKQRKALEKLAGQAGLSTDELIEVIETHAIDIPTGVEHIAPPAAKPLPDESTKRIVRLETDAFVRDVPEAGVVKSQLFAEALATGKPVQELWAEKYAPVIEAGKKIGAKKLQSNLEGQPTRAASTASERTDTTVDFSNINPETGKRWTSKEMEKYLGYAAPTSRL